MKIKALASRAKEGIWVTVTDGCGQFQMALHEAAKLIAEQGLSFNPTTGEWA